MKEEKHNNKNYYSVENYMLLKIISYNEINALVFLYYYILKFIRDNNEKEIPIYDRLLVFLTEQTKESYDKFKESIILFYKKNTNIKKDLEPNRIFPKIINPISFF